MGECTCSSLTGVPHNSEVCMSPSPSFLWCTLLLLLFVESSYSSVSISIKSSGVSYLAARDASTGARVRFDVALLHGIGRVVTGLTAFCRKSSWHAVSHS